MPKGRVDGRRSDGDGPTTRTRGQQPEKKAQRNRTGGGVRMQSVGEGGSFTILLQMTAIRRTGAGEIVGEGGERKAEGIAATARLLLFPKRVITGVGGCHRLHSASQAWTVIGYWRTLDGAAGLKPPRC